MSTICTGRSGCSAFHRSMVPASSVTASPCGVLAPASNEGADPDAAADADPGELAEPDAVVGVSNGLGTSAPFVPVGPRGVRPGGVVPPVAVGPSTGAVGPGSSLWVLSGVKFGSPIPAITRPATSTTWSSSTTAFLYFFTAASVTAESWLPRTNTYGSFSLPIRENVDDSTSVPQVVMSPLSTTASTPNCAT